MEKGDREPHTNKVDSMLLSNTPGTIFKGVANSSLKYSSQVSDTPLKEVAFGLHQ
jgi:hypothetical protein